MPPNSCTQRMTHSCNLLDLLALTLALNVDFTLALLSSSLPRKRLNIHLNSLEYSLRWADVLSIDRNIRRPVPRNRHICFRFCRGEASPLEYLAFPSPVLFSIFQFPIAVLKHLAVLGA